MKSSFGPLDQSAGKVEPSPRVDPRDLVRQAGIATALGVVLVITPLEILALTGLSGFPLLAWREWKRAVRSGSAAGTAVGRSGRSGVIE